MKGFGFRKAGRRGMGGRSAPHPKKPKSTKAGKTTKQPFEGSNGTFGFR